MTEAGTAELQQFWFPGWAAKIDGHEANAIASGPHAVVSCDVPAGDHVVEFRYQGLPQRRVGLAISLLSATVAAGILVSIGRPPKKNTR
jgi:hypothetical protein